MESFSLCGVAVAVPVPVPVPAPTPVPVPVPVGLGCGWCNWFWLFRASELLRDLLPFVAIFVLMGFVFRRLSENMDGVRLGPSGACGACCGEDPEEDARVSLRLLSLL